MIEHLARRDSYQVIAALGAAPRPALGAKRTQLRIGWVDDPQRRIAANRAQRNYWNAYVPEILSEVGLRAIDSSPAILRNRKQLAQFSTLLISDLEVSADAGHSLEQWVNEGGVLITLGTKGLDRLFGNWSVGRIEQPFDDFTCAATFAPVGHSLTAGVHWYLRPGQNLLILSPVEKVEPQESVVLARRQGADGLCYVARSCRCRAPL